jgi:hypothetical protein
MRFYVVTVKRVLEETYAVEVEADTAAEAKADAIEMALSEPPNHRRYRPKTWTKALKVKRS